MADLADWAENAALDWLMGGSTPTRPPGRFLALYSSATNDSTGGTELSGNGYARQAVTCGAAAAGTCSNTNAVAFTATGAWSAATHAAVLDASTAGNRIWHGPLAAARTLANGDTLTFAIGELDFTLA